MPATPAEVRLSDLGSDPAEPIVVSHWFADEGDELIAGDLLVELVIGGATFEVPAPINGRLAEICADVDDVVQVGALLARVEPEDEPDESDD